MIILGIIIISVLSPAVFLWMAIYFSKQKKTVHSLLCGFTCFYEAAFITFPIFYSVFTEFELEAEILVEPEGLALVLIGHLIFVLMFI